MDKSRVNLPEHRLEESRGSMSPELRAYIETLNSRIIDVNRENEEMRSKAWSLFLIVVAICLAQLVASTIIIIKKAYDEPRSYNSDIETR